MEVLSFWQYLDCDFVLASLSSLSSAFSLAHLSAADFGIASSVSSLPRPMRSSWRHVRWRQSRCALILLRLLLSSLFLLMLLRSLKRLSLQLHQ